MSHFSLPPKNGLSSPSSLYIRTTTSVSSKKGTLFPSIDHFEHKYYRTGSYRLRKLSQVHVEGDHATSIPMFYVENGEFVYLH